MKLIIAVFILISFLLPSTIFSKGPGLKMGPGGKVKVTKRVKTKIVYKKRMEFDFSGDDIEGDYKKPEGFYMVHRASTDFSDIVKFDLRFKSKIKKSVGYLE